jgi:hypothetical membrane protein
MIKRIATFTDKQPYLGPIMWILSVQYFIAQWIVAHAWATPFSISGNYISDLGNTVCGEYGGGYVCSPLHWVMNGSFVVFGLTLLAGSLFIYTRFRRTAGSLVGFLLIASSGFGTILVGAFPENEVYDLHLLGAVLSLGVGAVGVLVLAFALRQIHPTIRIYTALTAIICLGSFTLYSMGFDLGLDKGGMERLVSYPFTLWLIFFGLYMTVVRYKSRLK